MGAWGYGPTDSDQALDWLYEPALLCAQRVRSLVEAAEVSKYPDEFAHELRGAGELLRLVGRWMPSGDWDLFTKVADRLEKLLNDQDWLSDWTGPDEVAEALRGEIQALRELV